jgi:lactate permease
MTIISLIPILIPFLLLVILKRSAKQGMTVAFIVLAISAFVFWGMEFEAILASIIQGIHKSLGIILILFGAIVLLNVLKKTGAVDSINIGFNSLSQDMRIQVILVAFLFGALIEGVSGFGTPAVVVAPLLIALGFDRLISATIAIIANSVPVPFGAVGTPVQVGLSNIDLSSSELLNIAQTIVRIDLLAGVFIPTLLIIILLYNHQSLTKKNFLEILPFSILIGIVYVMVANLVSLIGFEFISIITPIITLGVSIILIRFNILVPKSVWRTNPLRASSSTTMPILTAWLPYLLVVLLLLLSRVIPAIKTVFLNLIDLSYNQILGYEEISSSLQILYNPGFILTVVALMAVFIQKGSISLFKDASSDTFKTMINAVLTLIPTLAMVQIFTNSALSTTGESMPVYLANQLSEILSGMWYLLASYVGMLGSFISGSATVSNLTFSQIQYQIAMNSNLDIAIVLSLGTIGAAIGNMICIHNIVSVSAVSDQSGQEGLILRKTIIPAIIYGLLVFVSVNILFGGRL